MKRPMPVKPEKCERCNRVLSKCKCPKRRDDPRIVQVFGRSCEAMPEDPEPESAEDREWRESMRELTLRIGRLEGKIELLERATGTPPDNAARLAIIQAQYDHDGKRD